MTEPSGFESTFPVGLVDQGIILTAWKKRPFRRLQPRYAASLLVNEDQRRPSCCIPDVGDKLAYLGFRHARAAHEDNAPRIVRGKEGPFTRSQPRTRDAEDASFRHYPVTTMQFSPADFSVVQKAVASDLSAKAPTRKR